MMRKDFVDEFCHEFIKELNWLQMARGVTINSAKRELG